VVVSTLPVTVAELAREVWLPAFGLGAALAGGLVAVRALTPLDTLPGVLLALVGGVLLYFAAYYALCLRPAERRLVRSLLPGRRAAARP
jgi:hypothetical protein